MTVAGRTIIERLNAARRNISGLKSLEQGALRVVSMPGPSFLLVPGITARLTRESTRTKVQILSRSSAQVRQLIATQSYDVGIVDRGAEAPGDTRLVQAEPFGVHHLCALPADDPLARQDRIAPADLDGRPLATLLDQHRATAALRALFSAAGARLNLRYQAQFYLPLMTFVEHGLAVAIVDVLSAESWCRMRGAPPDTIVFRPVTPDVILDCAILTPAQRPSSRLAQAFVEAWRAEVAEIEARWARSGFQSP
jgi:LysR substrate binding domain.